ncbi:mucin-2-like [Macrosteles quadrilineatus]|uniref:mucin-2-like n=1 Tax=Macrosteles quadrilineatus TaxID=74068 RepID=UPI0023E1A7EE|nr:mucin-2-like [Macrosteles quadrilineatus]XP_054256979.1 mucin-2-like [Macrosteles quadrilineatus]
MTTSLHPSAAMATTTVNGGQTVVGHPLMEPEAVVTVYKLMQQLETQSSIIIEGVANYNADRFEVNFLIGSTKDNEKPDIGFHFNQCLNWYTSCNTRLAGTWGKYEGPTHEKFPFRPGQPFYLEFYVTEAEFKVAVNGQHYLSYKHRVPFKDISKIQILGHITLDNVIFQTSPEYPSPLSQAKPVEGGQTDVESDTSCWNIMLEPKGIFAVYNLTSQLQAHSSVIVEGMMNDYSDSLSRNFVVDFLVASPCTEDYTKKMKKFVGISSLNTIFEEKQPDIAFHFSPRFYEPDSQNMTNITDCDTRLGGTYSHYKTAQEKFPFLRGQPFYLEFYITEDEFKVAVDGQHYLSYKHRVPLKFISKIQILGEITLDNVIFQNTTMYPSPLPQGVWICAEDYNKEQHGEIIRSPGVPRLMPQPDSTNEVQKALAPGQTKASRNLALLTEPVEYIGPTQDTYQDDSPGGCLGTTMVITGTPEFERTDQTFNINDESVDGEQTYVGPTPGTYPDGNWICMDDYNKEEHGEIIATEEEPWTPTVRPEPPPPTIVQPPPPTIVRPPPPTIFEPTPPTIVEPPPPPPTIVEPPPLPPPPTIVEPPPPPPPPTIVEPPPPPIVRPMPPTIVQPPPPSVVHPPPPPSVVHPPPPPSVVHPPPPPTIVQPPPPPIVRPPPPTIVQPPPPTIVEPPPPTVVHPTIVQPPPPTIVRPPPPPIVRPPPPTIVEPPPPTIVRPPPPTIVQPPPPTIVRPPPPTIVDPPPPTIVQPPPPTVVHPTIVQPPPPPIVQPPPPTIVQPPPPTIVRPPPPTIVQPPPPTIVRPPPLTIVKPPPPTIVQPPPPTIVQPPPPTIVRPQPPTIVEPPPPTIVQPPPPTIVRPPPPTIVQPPPPTIVQPPPPTIVQPPPPTIVQPPPPTIVRPPPPAIVERQPPTVVHPTIVQPPTPTIVQPPPPTIVQPPPPPIVRPPPPTIVQPPPPTIVRPQLPTIVEPPPPTIVQTPPPTIVRPQPPTIVEPPPPTIVQPSPPTIVQPPPPPVVHPPPPTIVRPPPPTIVQPPPPTVVHPTPPPTIVQPPPPTIVQPPLPTIVRPLPPTIVQPPPPTIVQPPLPTIVRPPPPRVVRPTHPTVVQPPTDPCPPAIHDDPCQYIGATSKGSTDEGRKINELKELGVICKPNPNPCEPRDKGKPGYVEFLVSSFDKIEDGAFEEVFTTRKQLHELQISIDAMRAIEEC